MSRPARSSIARRAEHRRARRRSIELVEAARLIWVVADSLVHLAGGVDASPWSQAMSHRLMRPEPGDLVVEVGGLRNGFDPDRVGWLRDIGRVPGSASYWHPDGYPDWYLVEPLVQPSRGPRRLVTWRNARFYAVPTDTGYHWPAAGGTISDRAGRIVARRGRVLQSLEFGMLTIDPVSAIRVTDIS